MVRQQKWRAIASLLMIWVSIYFNLMWPWAILFIIWVVQDVYSGTTYLTEAVTRKTNPVLFFSILGTWLFISAYILMGLFW